MGPVGISCHRLDKRRLGRHSPTDAVGTRGGRLSAAGCALSLLFTLASAPAIAAASPNGAGVRLQAGPARFGSGLSAAVRARVAPLHLPASALSPPPRFWVSHRRVRIHPVPLAVGALPGGRAAAGSVANAHQASAGAAGAYMPVQQVQLVSNYYVSSDATLTVQVDGTGGIPASGVSAVALELTLSSGMGGGSLLAFDSDGTLSDTSLVSFGYETAGVSNSVVLAPSGTGTVAFYNDSADDVSLSVGTEGYYTPAPGGAGFVPLTPTRVVDTANGTGTPSNTALGAGVSDSWAVAGGGFPVPLSASAVAVNVTAVDPQNGSYLVVFPFGAGRPSTASLSDPASGQDVADLVQVGLAPCSFSGVSYGCLMVYNNTGSTNLVIDLEGYYTTGSSGDAYVAISGTRLDDTQTPSEYLGGFASLANDVAQPFSVLGQVGPTSAPISVPTDVSAVALEVTAFDMGNLGNLRVYPTTGAAPPNAAALALNPNATAVTNLVFATVGGGGQISFYADEGANPGNPADTSVDLLVDLVGYFVAPPVGPTGSALYGDGGQPPSGLADQNSGLPPRMLAHPVGGGGGRGGASGPASDKRSHPCLGRPVDCATGNMFEQVSDLAIGGRGVPLAFVRTYNSLAAVSQTTPGPLGYGWTDFYASSLAVNASAGTATVTQGDGSTVAFSLSGSTYTAPAWVDATLTANPDGSYSFVEPDQVAYRFDPTGQLIAITDVNGYTDALAYNGSGELVSVTNPSGQALSFSYDPAGQIASVVDPAGRSVHYAYTNSELTSVTDAAGNTTGYGYAAANLLTTITDPNGATTTTSYDSAGQATGQVDPMGNQTSFAYAAGAGPDCANQTTITDPLGRVSVDCFASDLLTSQTIGYDTAGQVTTTFSYDPAGDIASVTDADGNTTSYAYDSRANLISITDADGRTTSYTYNARNQPTSVTDAMGVTTTFTYTGVNLTAVSTPDSATATVATSSLGYADGEAGELTSITDPDANTTSFGYDGYGELVSVTDPTGGRTAFSYGCATGCYDNIGLVYASTTPSGQTTSYAYDGDGRVVSVTDPLGAVTTTSYDGDGNPLSVTDPDGNLTVYAYNGDGEQTSVTSGYGSAQASTTTTGYDGDGEVVSRTDGNAATTSYAYNSVGELVDSTAPATAADPNGLQTGYGYDPAGQLTSLTAADGAQTDYGYDPAGSLTSVSYSRDPAGNTSFGYDGDGRRTYMADASGTSSYAYDSLGELTSATDGAGHTVDYGYDAAGNLISLSYPGAGTVSQTFNANNQLASISDWLGNTSTFSYDADQNLALIGYANGVTESYGYNAADQIISVADQYSQPTNVGPRLLTLSDFAYTRDPNQQVSSAASPGSAQPGAAYGYTPLNQLASATVQPPPTPSPVSLTCGALEAICNTVDNTITAASTGNYSYDRAGNLTGLPGGTTQSFDGADELLNTTTATALTTSYSYNQRGDRITATTGAASVNYGYNQADQLTSYTSSALAATYAYNGDGLRTSAATTLAGQTVAQTASYTYNLTSPVPEILGDGTNYYLYGPGGLPVEQIGPANTVSYLGHDQQGSTRILMSADKSIVGAYNYTPYGATTSQAGATTPLQYDGAYHDPTGLYYLNARYYDPATGQFLTRDPLQALTGAPYSYVGNNPLNASDPSGLCAWYNFYCEGVQPIARMASAAAHWITKEAQVAWRYVSTSITWTYSEIRKHSALIEEGLAGVAGLVCLVPLVDAACGIAMSGALVGELVTEAIGAHTTGAFASQAISTIALGAVGGLVSGTFEEAAADANIGEIARWLNRIFTGLSSTVSVAISRAMSPQC